MTESIRTRALVNLAFAQGVRIGTTIDDKRAQELARENAARGVRQLMGATLNDVLTPMERAFVLLANPA